MYYIIGSGPTGIATAKTLLAKGIKVIMLDGGVVIESDKLELLSRVNSTPKDNWPAHIIEKFKAGVSSSSKGVQKKLIYGSDFPYREVEEHFPIKQKNIGSFSPTLAQGGFSNVWGAAMLPYTKEDISDWPITIDDLEQYYQSVLSFVPLASTEDNLMNIFPTYTSSSQRINLSKQGAAILNTLKEHREYLNKQDVYFGNSRLAVASGEDSKSCLYCGLCLYGCPKSIIYNSSDTLKQLLLDKNFSYLPSHVVEKLVEDRGQVRIYGYHRVAREKFVFDAKKAYLASGVISSARILLNSKAIYNKVISLKVSEYFLLPTLLRQNIVGVTKESLHTLSQIFLECFDKEISPYGIHMQLYSYSDLYQKALSKMFFGIKPILGLLQNQILGRLLAIQGYLHSAHSSSISLSFDGSLLHLTGQINPLAKVGIKKLIRKFNNLYSHTGMFFIKPMLQVGLPGEGRHVGCSFPMSKKPTEFQSDILGRPFNWKNIHLVDASVFPTVPAPTITFTAMANAQRIADNSLLGE